MSLEFLDVRGKVLLFDGVLSIGGVRRYVQGAPLKVYSIEGYGENDRPSTVVYVQSQEASRDSQYDIWYQLKKPSDRYRRFHSVFHWVATLGKHTIDFLETRPNGARAGLEAFRSEFYEWLTCRFTDNKELQEWLKAFGGTDFRKAVHAHIDYLGQEAWNLSNAKTLLKHSLWADCMRDDHQLIKPQPILCEKTITSPHTFLCFKNRYFAEWLEETHPSDEIRDAQQARKRLLGFPHGTPPQTITSPFVSLALPSKKTLFRVGDVVSILPDEVEERLWRKQAKTDSNTEWYAYVQRTGIKRNGEQQLYVIWLYRPEDTTISTTDYPVTKELFISDHCNCQEPELLAVEVVRQCTVEWYSKAMDTRDDFLVRQKYVTEVSSFVSLKESDFRCDCHKPKTSAIDNCLRGDTVYITTTRGEKQTLEPVVIDRIDREQQEVTVRRLLRLQEWSEAAGSLPKDEIADNELIWTDILIIVSCRRVKRKCYVRHVSRTDVVAHAVPFPYNRGGAGDYWMLSSRMTMPGNKPNLELLQEAPALLKQGPDLNASSPAEKLIGLSLFSGCGNLDKGLEEGGAVEFETAVEMCPEAVHTLHANARQPEKLQLWLGSVDDYLKCLLTNKDIRPVARLGSVAVIAAGSPCPGFSTLQQDWKSPKSLRNASHVTTFCSFVDIYRPKYAFLENVVNMACTRVGFEEERVLSQIIACLVSMGYQVRQFIMSAWNYGSPQHRSRLILSIAAPGLALLTPPPVTHSHPNDYRSRSIGDLLNGQKFGAQDDGPTPLPFVTAEKATAHLPNIDTGAVQGCIAYPDHRLCRPINLKERTIMKHIPKSPPGMGLLEAGKLGLVPHDLYAERKEIGKAYKRMRKDGLFPTVITRPSPHDARAGPGVHWAQDRPITIEEARITQGIPPEDVIVGSISEQIKQVGNAVDRRVSEQLGLSLRYALGDCSFEALNADKFSVSGYADHGSRQRRSLVCVKVPVSSSRSKHLLDFTKDASIPNSEANEEIEPSSSSSTSFNSLESVLHAHTQSRASSSTRTTDSYEASHLEDETIQESASKPTESIGEAVPEIPAEDLLSTSTTFHRVSSTLSKGTKYLRPSFSPFSVVSVRGKRQHDLAVSIQLGPPQSKRAKPTWSPLVVLPSGEPPVELGERSSDINGTAEFEQTATFVESDYRLHSGKQDRSVPTQQHQLEAVRRHQTGNFKVPPKARLAGELHRPAVLLDSSGSHGAPKPFMSSEQHHGVVIPNNTQSLDPPTKLVPSVELPRHTKPASTALTVLGTSRSSSPSRKTRHSGLSADRGPKSWNKIPEKEIRRAKEMARRSSRPYA